MNSLSLSAGVLSAEQIICQRIAPHADEKNRETHARSMWRDVSDRESPKGQTKARDVPVEKISKDNAMRTTRTLVRVFGIYFLAF
jgi:hypothetical protein